MIGLLQAQVQYHDDFDGDGLGINTFVGGGIITQSAWSSVWEDDTSDLIFNAKGTNVNRRAIAYSEQSFQSNSGFVLTAYYKVGSIGNIGNHNLSFGLISEDTDLSTYTDNNPFGEVNSVYSLGVNVTTNLGTSKRGLNFTDGVSTTALDQSGTNVQFPKNITSRVDIVIGQNGEWSYYINDVMEASGVIATGFDLSKPYHFVVYGKDANGGEKSIQSVTLTAGQTRPSTQNTMMQGDRADWMRGTWGLAWNPSRFFNGNVEGVSIEPFLEQLDDVKTLDYVQVKLGSSYIYSPVFTAPHQLIESLWQGDTDENGDPINLAVPRWVDNNADGMADEDPFLDWLLASRAAGLRTQVYVNSSNMLQRYDNGGRIDSPAEIPDVTDRWKAHCDANHSAFVNSEDYHTGIWNVATGAYEDAQMAFPERKYMFCFTEFILKDYAIRYGDLIDAWVFDSGEFMEENGDHGLSGVYEEQRIFEAFTLAVRAGNSDAAVSFNNGPNRDETNAANGIITPFSQATRFDDYMFGHPYNGGNNIGKDKADWLNGVYPTNYGRNYSHLLWMEETGGNVHLFRDLSNPVNMYTWDDKVVGHFFPPMSTTSWSGGNTPALAQADFNLWNETVVQNGGSIVWGAALGRSNLANQNGGILTVREDWTLPQILGADAHLCPLPNTTNPGAPVWYRALTILPEATNGQAYYHVLIEGEDFWDPEGDDITTLLILAGAPSWLNIVEDPANPGHWILSGTPDEAAATDHVFEMEVTDINNLSDTREVKLIVNDNPNCIDYIIHNSNAIILESENAEIAIESNGIIPAGNPIDFSAGNYILLSEEFEVELGAVFHAFIQFCR